MRKQVSPFSTRELADRVDHPADTIRHDDVGTAAAGRLTPVSNQRVALNVRAASSARGYQVTPIDTGITASAGAVPGFHSFTGRRTACLTWEAQFTRLNSSHLPGGHPV